MIGAMPAVAVRHERRRQEKKVVCVNNLNTGDREGGGGTSSSSNTTGNRRPSLLTLQSPHSQSGTPITSPPYVQNSLPDIYVCSKVRPRGAPPAHQPPPPYTLLPSFAARFFSHPSRRSVLRHTRVRTYCPRRVPHASPFPYAFTRVTDNTVKPPFSTDTSIWTSDTRTVYYVFFHFNRFHRRFRMDIVMSACRLFNEFTFNYYFSVVTLNKMHLHMK